MGGIKFGSVPARKAQESDAVAHGTHPGPEGTRPDVLAPSVARAEIGKLKRLPAELRPMGPGDLPPRNAISGTSAKPTVETDAVADNQPGTKSSRKKSANRSSSSVNLNPATLLMALTVLPALVRASATVQLQDMDATPSISPDPWHGGLQPLPMDAAAHGDVDREPFDLKPEYRPPSDAKTWSNGGYMKDFGFAMHSGLWTYSADPTKNPGVEWLSRGSKLADGLYAYAYRAHDNRIAIVNTDLHPNTDRVVKHSYLASGKDVYAAGILRVKDNQIVRISSESGHYRPDPNVVLKEDCTQDVTSMQSLEVFRDKLNSMDLAAPDLLLSPHHHPDLIQQSIDCQVERLGVSFQPDEHSQAPVQQPPLEVSPERAGQHGDAAVDGNAGHEDPTGKPNGPANSKVLEITAAGAALTGLTAAAAAWRSRANRKAAAAQASLDTTAAQPPDPQARAQVLSSVGMTACGSEPSMEQLLR
jgi:hypothetical protein